MPEDKKPDPFMVWIARAIIVILLVGAAVKYGQWVLGV